MEHVQLNSFKTSNDVSGRCTVAGIYSGVPLAMAPDNIMLAPQIFADARISSEQEEAERVGKSKDLLRRYARQLLCSDSVDSTPASSAMSRDEVHIAEPTSAKVGLTVQSSTI